MKRALVIRLGAFGDMVMITPVIQRLKDLDYYVILNTSKRGLEIFKHDPRIDEFIEHDESIPISDVHAHWEKLTKEVKHDLFINFSESIECNVALHPASPIYIYPKKERAVFCDRNYYDVTNDWSKLTGCQTLPTLYFTPEEEGKVKNYLKKDKFNILWCLSGSGKNKVYPWTDYVMGETLNKYKDVHFITVGDEKCQILEDIAGSFKGKVTQLAGKTSIRESMCLTKFVDLVISPDTGVLHSSGCFKTPKIGLLGHSTKNNITKYFDNDYSIESVCECGPCFRLIYDYEVQCPIDPITKSAWCMSKIKPEEVFKQIRKVREEAMVLA